uniref:Uncharacterized protein n=1 Tax=Anguilla anguilla TaxID=7936 RepID=A0A0E9TYG4_ANGAN
MFAIIMRGEEKPVQSKCLIWCIFLHIVHLSAHKV